MNRKSTEERQKEIVRAALELLDESGVQNLTISHIAERVGISEAALYRHFDGKLDIISGCIEFVGKQMEERLSTISSEETSALEEMKGIFIRHLEFIEKNPGTARLLFSDEVHFNDQALRHQLAEVVKGRTRFLENLIRKGQAEGVVRDDVEPANLALTFLGMIQARVLTWSLSGRKTGLKEEGEDLWKAFRTMVES